METTLWEQDMPCKCKREYFFKCEADRGWSGQTEAAEQMSAACCIRRAWRRVEGVVFDVHLGCAFFHRCINALLTLPPRYAAAKNN